VSNQVNVLETALRGQPLKLGDSLLHEEAPLYLNTAQSFSDIEL